jgi:hypothetical protein
MVGDELADLAGVGSNHEVACAVDGAERPIGYGNTNKFVGPLHGLGARTPPQDKHGDVDGSEFGR